MIKFYVNGETFEIKTKIYQMAHDVICKELWDDDLIDYTEKYIKEKLIN